MLNKSVAIYFYKICAHMRLFQMHNIKLYTYRSLSLGPQARTGTLPLDPPGDRNPQIPSSPNTPSSHYILYKSMLNSAFRGNVYTCTRND